MSVQESMRPIIAEIMEDLSLHFSKLKEEPIVKALLCKDEEIWVEYAVNMITGTLTEDKL